MERKKPHSWRPKGSKKKASFGLLARDDLLPSRSLQEGFQPRDQGALLGVLKEGFAGWKEAFKSKRIPDLGVQSKGGRRVLQLL